LRDFFFSDRVAHLAFDDLIDELPASSIKASRVCKERLRKDE